MPPKRNKSKRNSRPAAKRSNKSNRRSSRFQHSRSILITTLQTKQSHKKEEIYPIPLNKLISRNNVGVDAEVRLVGYSMSVQLATGNDCSTVSLNISHSGPWVRKGSSADTFDQQFVEHSVRGKSCLFKKPVIARSELEYLNPDTADNYIELRVRDPCGVIPGVVFKIEFRAHLIRRTPQSAFDDPSSNAIDRYEDQDVSTGTSSGAPSPPAAVKHAPQVITHIPFGNIHFDLSPTVNSGTITYSHPGDSSTFVVAPTVPPQIISGKFTYQASSGDLQNVYNAAGFDGTITEKV